MMDSAETNRSMISVDVWPPSVRAGSGYTITRNPATHMYDLAFENKVFYSVSLRELGLMIIWARIKDGAV
jgi:hypothetical protein